MRHRRMPRATSTILALLFLLSPALARAQLAPSYPQDDKLANEPAPWTVPGKWGPRGNWGRWGEQDKRGMLNFLTPDLIIKAAAVAAAPPKTNSGTIAPQASRSPEPGAVALPADAAGPATGAGAPAAKESWLTRAGDPVAVGEQIISTAVIVLVGVGAAMAFLWFRRRRAPQQIHRRFEKR